MPCLLLIIALVTPRLAVFMLWLFGWFNGVFPNIIWPILGFIFLPTTLLWYSAVAHWYPRRLDAVQHRHPGRGDAHRSVTRGRTRRRD